MKKSVCLFLVTSIVLSCSEVGPSFSDKEYDQNVAITKVLKISEDNDPRSLLVKFAEVPSSQLVSDLCVGGVVKAERLFSSTPGKEELESEFGLDRWYQVFFHDDVNLDEVAAELASQSSVLLVEFNTKFEREPMSVLSPGGTSQSISVPVQTKAEGAVFNDPYLQMQWNYINSGSKAYSATAVAGADINVKDVWTQLTCGDPSIVVAVIDEAVMYSHPDLKANMWVNEGEIPGNGIDDDKNGFVDDVYGYNFAGNGGVLEWDRKGNSGHGSHTAGTIAAVNNNAIGVCGVAGGSGKNDGCRLMSCQVFSGYDGGTGDIIAKAFKYAADMGASVASCSFGYASAFASDNAYIKAVGSVEIDAIHYFEACRGNNKALTDGNIVVFSSGNNAQDFAHYPGAFVDIISVSAFGPDFLPAYYTNYGPGCNITAPGGEYGQISSYFESMVLSTVPSAYATVSGSLKDYEYYQGTSMACPHVSGVVALALAYAQKQGKTFTRSEFKNMLLSSTCDIDKRIAAKKSKKYPVSGKSELQLAPYYHMMGTGAVDAWAMMMKIDGIGSSTAKIGESQWIDLSDAFGSASVSLTYLGVDVPQATIDAMGLQKIKGAEDKSYPAVPAGDCYAYVQYGRLYIYPTKIGAGKISITAVGGGSELGGGDNAPGGMELKQEVSIVARDADGGNGTGGWL